MRLTTQLILGVLALAIAGWSLWGPEDPPHPPPPLLSPDWSVTPSTVSSPWGAEAEAWWVAEAQAASEGIPNLVSFYAIDLVLDDQAGGFVVRGRQAVLDAMVARHGPAIAGMERERLFISANDHLRQWAVPFGTMIDLLDRVTLGDDGVELIVRSTSVVAARQLHDADLDALEDRAREYVMLWNGESGSSLSTVYAPDARIEDSLLGVSVSGHGEIAAVMGSGNRTQVRIAELPEGRGPALYGADTSGSEGSFEETYVLQWDDGAGCPGVMAVTLVYEDGLVVSEHRYYELESARRCLDTAGLPSGWWSGLEVPDPVLTERTGTLRVEGGPEVAVYNGTPALEAFVEWGYDRFREAGMPLPVLDSVTFLAKRSKCEGIRGLYQAEGGSGSVTLCGTEVQICKLAGCSGWVLPYRKTLLHELAHAWIDQHVDERTRRAFMEIEGVEHWHSVDVPWEDRGVERAADVIAFGLVDAVGSLWVDEEEDCEVGEVRFRLLTGANPIAPCESPSATPDTIGVSAVSPAETSPAPARPSQAPSPG